MSKMGAPVSGDKLTGGRWLSLGASSLLLWCLLRDGDTLLCATGSTGTGFAVAELPELGQVTQLICEPPRLERECGRERRWGRMSPDLCSKEATGFSL